MQRENVSVDEHCVEFDVNHTPLGWKFLPTEALITIFGCLSYRDLCRCDQVCKHWSKVGSLNSLWRRLFFQDFHAAVEDAELSFGYSWKDEYKRLCDSVPCVEYSCISKHSDEVLHVSFSHDGTMFCTCSKDATVKVFYAKEPFDVLFTDYLGPNSLFHWSYTQFSQFNSCDTELLVSGRCDGSESGEIIVYSLDEHKFELQSRIRIQPYDVMGAWLNESYILSSRCYHLPMRHCLSQVLLNKSSQEVHNLRQSIVESLYMFKSEIANAVIYLKVADMTQLMSKLKKSVSSGDYNGVIHDMHLRILLQHALLEDDLGLLQALATSQKNLQTDDRSLFKKLTAINVERNNSDFLPTPDAKRPLLDQHGIGEAERPIESVIDCTADTFTMNNPFSRSSSVKIHATTDSKPLSYKVLLAFTGKDMNSSHQIAMKFIMQEECDEVKHVDIERQRRKVNSSRAENLVIYDSITTDNWDHVIDVGGQLVGMETSSCGQYLFASYLKFSYDNSEQHNRPNVSSAVTISMFDLLSMTELMVLDGPSAVSSVFYLYLSCAEEYLASGSEDNQGYLWDKHYGCLVSNFKHNNVVNCVAINPCDTTMAVSVSDDHTIKIWRSKGFMRSLVSHKQDS